MIDSKILPRKILERLAFIFVFAVVLLGIYFSRTDLTYYEGTWVREDGFVEWMTVFALFLGIVMNLYRAMILSPFRNPSFVFGTYMLALIFLFGLGEEISWGQRIIEQFMDFKVPAFFIKYNTQHEMNFHNLKFGDTKINKLVFGTLLGIGVAFYFLILPVLYRKVEKIKACVDRFAVPLPRVYHTVAYLILAIMVQAIAGGKKGEILEFGGCWIFLLMCFEPYNRDIFSRVSFKR